MCVVCQNSEGYVGSWKRQLSFLKISLVFITDVLVVEVSHQNIIF